VTRPGIFQQLEDHHHKGGLCGCPHVPAEVVESDEAYRLRMAELGRQELVRMRDAGLPVDLDQVETMDLAALGESVRPARLAERLDQVLGRDDEQGPPSTRTRYLALCQHELDHQLRQVHDHGRLREERVDLDLDHDRIRLMGIDQTAPEHGTADRPEILEPERGSGVDRGGSGLAPRGQSTGLDRIVEKDPITEYLRNVPDPDDSEWTPT
jgi:hypothetical protein